ncbi:E3 ubiquitin-protein ligase UPL5-like isoform X2 [Rutidosis leptorrhynchoides]|uniref:E3 ubiquitin-protein ligase UPL5-like isoform X2 n=1 Tax=Rutidosis leptorrhynchoides TaxID=125765 RepID=UPI003A9A06F8
MDKLKDFNKFSDLKRMKKGVKRFCKGEKLGFCSASVKRNLKHFLKLMPTKDVELAKSFLSVLVSFCVPEALVMLYKCTGKTLVVDIVRSFLTDIIYMLPQPIASLCMPVVLKLCLLFRTSDGNYGDVYKLCRFHLVLMVKQFKSFNRSSNKQMLNFGSGLAWKISEDLVLTMEESTSNFGPSKNDIDRFVAFLRMLKVAVKNESMTPISISTLYRLPLKTSRVKYLYVLFDDMLTKMVMCLDTMEDGVKKNKVNGGWSQYLVILNELNDISKLYDGAEKDFWKRLRYNKVSLCYLVVSYAIRGENYEWILEHKELTNFESRSHLVRLLLPQVLDDVDYDDVYHMLVDRSQLLVDSFEYIAHDEPRHLRVGLNMEFLNEEASGPGVLREWFLLVCREIFNHEISLFIACPNDCRRFFPNPASKVNPMHLEYYNFAGRVIALALMHSIHVGIAFDRSFYLQLAGVNVSLEDIKDAEPYLYSSCKKILDMDPIDVDQDVLGLTFVSDIQEFGSVKVDEFFPGGAHVTVNSRNRKEYVDLLIQHRFTKSVSEQINAFAKGFSNIVGEERIQKIFFKSLYLDDFDKMLYGNESDLCVEDWKAHTVYRIYEETDTQIRWFWKIVGEMTAKQRKALLFFWTSIEYLPANGFSGLVSKLMIHKSDESINRQPSSHTCFYQLCLPAYPSQSIMQSRLNFITQDHVAYSFGSV